MHEWVSRLSVGMLARPPTEEASRSGHARFVGFLAAEDGTALEATPAGRVYSAHYLNETGPVRNIPGSVVDETIDHGQVVEKLADRTVYYDAKNDVTVVQSDTTGKIMSVRRGAP